MKGRYVLLCTTFILGMYTRFPTNVPVFMNDYITIGNSCGIIKRVPLQRPSLWLMLLNNITRLLTFNSNLCAGIPKKWSLFRYFCGYRVSQDYDFIKSQLLCTVSLPVVFDIINQTFHPIYSFIFWTNDGSNI